ncbi:hypothetical protein [Sodalis sp. RH18]
MKVKKIDKHDIGGLLAATNSGANQVTDLEIGPVSSDDEKELA